MLHKCRIEVYRRMILAKILLNSGERYCSAKHDVFEFSKGILLLHDAVENALGAIADHLGAFLKDRNSMMSYYNLIKAVDSDHRNPPQKTQMNRLNTIRNDIKHQGILPSVDSNAHLPRVVYELISEVCRTYLDLDFDSISLKSLIKNRDIREYINKAEELIHQQKYDEALIELSYVVYSICEHKTIEETSPTRDLSLVVQMVNLKRPFQFIQPDKLDHIISLVAHGVDLALYKKFRLLAPKVGKNMQTSELCLWSDRRYNHSENLTEANVRFCLNFCIDTALKYQISKEKEEELIQYPEIYEDIIEPKNDIAHICYYETSSQNTFVLTSKPGKDPELAHEVLQLKKGEKIVGWVQDSTDNLDKWFIMSKDIPQILVGLPGFGYVLKTEVVITQMKRKDLNDKRSWRERYINYKKM